MVVRAIVFDIGGVIEITPKNGWTRKWEAKLDLAPEQFAERTSELWAAGSIGAISESEFHSRITETFDLTKPEFDDFIADLWSAYLGELNQDLVNYFRNLRPNYRTAILSNSFVGAREREQSCYRMEEMAEFIIYSHEVGMCKPDPRIYALTCERLGVTAEETIFLDDLEVNVQAGRDAGMQSILFKDNGQAIAEIQLLLNPNLAGRDW